jgi:flagellum-specific peptidoglycan hydrolase FlgJ
MKRLEFIAMIMPWCIEAETESGIPRGWFAGEAMQETGGYGTDDVAVHAHNLFGTKSDKAGNYKGYAVFKDWHESILYQGWQLNQHLYLPFKGFVMAGKFKEYGNAIQKAGYCDPKGLPYGDAIQSLAEQYDLLPKPAIPTPKLSVAQEWAITNGIFDNPVDWEKPVTMNTLAWALMKSRGKL